MLKKDILILHGTNSFMERRTAGILTDVFNKSDFSVYRDQDIISDEECEDIWDIDSADEDWIEMMYTMFRRAGICIIFNPFIGGVSLELRHAVRVYRKSLRGVTKSSLPVFLCNFEDLPLNDSLKDIKFTSSLTINTSQVIRSHRRVSIAPEPLDVFGVALRIARASLSNPRSLVENTRINKTINVKIKRVLKLLCVILDELESECDTSSDNLVPLRSLVNEFDKVCVTLLSAEFSAASCPENAKKLIRSENKRIHQLLTQSSHRN